MAFFINLIALRWNANKYEVHSHIETSIDIWLLDQKNLMVDVSANSSYLDEMTVLARRALPEYLMDRGHTSYGAARAWYESLPADVQFILVHRGEWSSGMEP